MVREYFTQLGLQTGEFAVFTLKDEDALRGNRCRLDAL